MKSNNLKFQVKSESLIFLFQIDGVKFTNNFFLYDNGQISETLDTQNYLVR